MTDTTTTDGGEASDTAGGVGVKATKPLANTTVWGGSTGRFATSTLTKVDTSGQCQVNASLETDLALDDLGYDR